MSETGPEATVEPAIDGLELRHVTAEVNGIRMHYVEAGEGETVLFLHGFPEFWYSWRHQMRAVAGSYRVVAPDLRGYNLTENAGPYDTTTLQADVLGLIAHLGVERVHLVGHDWGGALAWLVAMDHPQVLDSLTICNMPHPVLFQRSARRPRQLLRSLYILFFQLPWLPERVLAMRDYQVLARGIIRDCAPGTFTRDEVKAYLASWREHGLNGGLNWYRALLRRPNHLPDPAPLVSVPTLMIWGEADRALGKELTTGTEEFVQDLSLHYLPGVSHWVQQDARARVNTLLAGHLARVTAGA